MSRSLTSLRPAASVSRLATCVGTILVAAVAMANPVIDEDFEGFQPGLLDGQSGWTGGEATLVVPTSVPGFGEQAVSVGGTPFSPALMSPTNLMPLGTLTLDVLIPASNSVTYRLALVNDQSFVSVLSFTADGGFALRRSIGACLTSDQPIDGSWSAGVPFQVQLETRPDPDSALVELDIRIDGQLIEATTTGIGCGSPRTGDRFTLDFLNAAPGEIIVDNVRFDASFPGDLGGDGTVGIGDLVQLLAAWGPCPDGCGPADFDGDGVVGITDLLVILSAWDT